MKIYGYVRVSAKDQNPERQIIALQEQKIDKQNIYIDKFSGKDFNRPEYLKMIKRLKKEDIVIIKSIDRLGRNYQEILEQWQKITKDIGADIRVLDMPLLDTVSRDDDLTKRFIADLVLQILAYVAETERAFIKQRQAEGIAAARARGVKFGNSKGKLPEQFDKYFDLWMQGKVSTRKAAEKLNISHSTFYRRCKERMTDEICNIR